MIEEHPRIYFGLGFRIGAWSALVVFLALLFIGLIHLESPLNVLVPLGGAVATFMAVYLITRKMINRRVQYLKEMLRAISNKQFDDSREIKIGRKDEIDQVIAEAIQASNTIERELQRMVRLENYRKEFIGDISHELKTPIFAVQGFIETLLDGALEDEQVNREFLNKAMRNVNRLTVLTRDLMEISKLETGQLKSNIHPVPLKVVVQEVIDTLQYKAEKEKVMLQVGEIDGTLRVMADRHQIKQVLINLVENGIKYNRPGGAVKIGLDKFTRNDPKACIFVRDTGIGIDPKDLKRVTERFFRVDKSRSRDKGGTGLGLSIVKHILESHGQKLEVSSISGNGSTFTFCLDNADRVLG